MTDTETIASSTKHRPSRDPGYAREYSRAYRQRPEIRERELAKAIASSTIKAAAPTIASSIVVIEQRRAKLHISHAQFCRAACIDVAMWWKLRKGKHPAAARTIARLERVLDELAGGGADGRPPSPSAIAMLFRAVLALVGRAQALDGAALLAQAVDFSIEKPRDPVWLAFARARRLAIYIITVELEIPNADLARAIGCSRQNVKQARDKVEEWRDDVCINALIGDVAQTMGR